jgi:hypothetical protein
VSSEARFARSSRCARTMSNEVAPSSKDVRARSSPSAEHLRHRGLYRRFTCRAEVHHARW